MNDERSPSFRLGIVGCGAISEMGHIPAALNAPSVTLTTLVDLDLDRAKAMGEQFGIADCRDSMNGLENSVDGVIAALPHNVHRSVGADLLNRGLHVLMEKPLGCSVAECEALRNAADNNDRLLSVALVRRFVAANRLAKLLIDKQVFGKVLSFQMDDARVFSWPIKTPFLVNPSYPGRGVLIGNGSHFFDLVLWWFGDVAHVSCIADARNGSETDATVTLKMQSGAEGFMRLSRVRALEDKVRITFENAVLELPPFGPDVRLLDREGRPLIGAIPEIDDSMATNSSQLAELMALQIEDFVTATRGGSGPAVDADFATRTIALVERCEEAIEQVFYPWESRRALPEDLATILISASDVESARA